MLALLTKREKGLRLPPMNIITNIFAYFVDNLVSERVGEILMAILSTSIAAAVCTVYENQRDKSNSR